MLVGAAVFFTAGSAFGANGSSVHGAAKLFQWRPFLAPFHAVVLHFPIGFVAAAFALELFRWHRPSDDLRRATTLILWLALGSAIVAATFGLMRAEGGAYDPQAVALHRAFGLTVPGLILLTIVASYYSVRRATARHWNFAYRGSLLCTLGVIGIAGHLGGSLTHGANYLVENAPSFVREFFMEAPRDVLVPSVSNENEKYYTDKVQPIFSAKCYPCHGGEKHKSGYRLDQPEIALKGGDSGEAAIKPGDPGASHLVRLILLPSESDEVMPPPGKQPLTAEEIGIILTWIRNGASFPAAPPTASPR